MNWQSLTEVERQERRKWLKESYPGDYEFLAEYRKLFRAEIEIIRFRKVKK